MNLAGREYARYQPQSQGARGYPSYSSRGGGGGRGQSYGHHHQPNRDYERQEYSGRSDAFSGNKRGYGQTMYGRQPQRYSGNEYDLQGEFVKSNCNDSCMILQTEVAPPTDATLIRALQVMSSPLKARWEAGDVGEVVEDR